MVGDTWMGMIMDEPGIVPKYWNDGSPVDYTNWEKNYPSDQKNRLYLRLSSVKDSKKYSKWRNQGNNEYDHYPICMVDAIRKKDS